jgi:hypothetical protein
MMIGFQANCAIYQWNSQRNDLIGCFSDIPKIEWKRKKSSSSNNIDFKDVPDEAKCSQYEDSPCMQRW